MELILKMSNTTKINFNKTSIWCSYCAHWHNLSNLRTYHTYDYELGYKCPTFNLPLVSLSVTPQDKDCGDKCLKNFKQAYDLIMHDIRLSGVRIDWELI